MYKFSNNFCKTRLCDEININILAFVTQIDASLSNICKVMYTVQVKSVYKYAAEIQLKVFLIHIVVTIAWKCLKYVHRRNLINSKLISSLDLIYCI